MLCRNLLPSPFPARTHAHTHATHAHMHACTTATIMRWVRMLPHARSSAHARTHAPFAIHHSPFTAVHTVKLAQRALACAQAMLDVVWCKHGMKFHQGTGCESAPHRTALRYAQVSEFEDNAVIIKEGDPGATFYIIERGTVVCYKRSLVV